MTRSSFAAVLAALLLALPATAAAGPHQQLALGQERAYMQQAPPTTTAAGRALAQERAYTQATTVAGTPARPAVSHDDGAPLGLIAAVVAGVLLAVAVVLTARRRHVHRPRLAGSTS